jgi:hypothetical protein
MQTSTVPKPTTSAGSTEIDPAVAIALEILVADFCDRDEYHPEVCLPWCTLCRDALLARKEGHA